MKILPRRLPARFSIIPAILGILMIAGLSWFGPVSRVSAHAELVRTDPPINGLVIAPPSELQLVFSEDIAAADPAPSVRVLSEDGTEKPVTVRIREPRELLVEVRDMENGTWTVVWAVKSATDGHQLNGTYAFRIGGGLPAGVATVEGERPAVWGVATRWLTFLGVALAASGFLFNLIVLGGGRETPSVSRGRSRLIIAGALVSLIATLIEPILQTLFPPSGVDLTLGSAIRGLPDGWWIRPITLVPLLVLSLVVAYAARGRISAPVAIVGGVLGLDALIGLSLTSHAAGRENWRTIAVIVDIVHQWSTALWIGGLACLVLWWTRKAEPDDESKTEVPVPLKRFSAIALVLFAIAVVSGVINAGFVLPKKETSLGFGLGTRELPAISKLWSSDYGWVLLIKVLVLLIPFALAIYHRRAIGHAVRTGVAIATKTLRTTLRLEFLVAIAVVLGGSILALSAPPTISQSPLQRVTLASFANPELGDPTEIVHLTIDPARQGKNQLDVRLTDLTGAEETDVSAARVTLTTESLSHATFGSPIPLQPTTPGASTYRAEGLDLSLDGWWRVLATVERDGQDPTAATFYLLLPDPNVHGFDSPATPDSDPNSQALFERGLSVTTSLTSIRRTEHIGSGLDALVVADYSWTTGANGQPPSFEARTLFSGSFVNRSNGSAPPLPTVNGLHSVTIGDQSWQVLADGQWLEQSLIRYQPPSEWASTYEGAQEFQLGATETIDGEECQIITFHTPNAPSQSEAWFMWWVGKDTGRVHRTAMVANMHYMVWDYRDFDADFTVDGPPADATPGTPGATPGATPAS